MAVFGTERVVLHGAEFAGKQGIQRFQSLLGGQRGDFVHFVSCALRLAGWTAEVGALGARELQVGRLRVRRGVVLHDSVETFAGVQTSISWEGKSGDLRLGLLPLICQNSRDLSHARIVFLAVFGDFLYVHLAVRCFVEDCLQTCEVGDFSSGHGAIIVISGRLKGK